MSQETNVIFGTALRADVPLNLVTRGENPLLLGGADGAGKNVPLPLTESALRSHILLVGAGGTGKTNAGKDIAQKLLTRLTDKEILIFFDPDGAYREAFYEEGDAVFASDDAATGPDGADFWNLFNELDYGPGMRGSVDAIARAVFRGRRSPTSETAAELFSACILCYILGNEPEDRTNEGFAAFIAGLTPEEMKEKFEAHDELRALSATLRLPQGGSRALLTLQRTVRELLTGNYAETGTLSMRALIEDGEAKKVFVIPAPDGSDLAAAALLLQIAVSAARQADERRITLFLDGLERLPELPALEEALVSGTRNLSAVAALRSVTALQRAYPEARAAALLDAFGTRFFFRTQDGATRAWAQSLHGKNVKHDRYSPTAGKGGTVDRQREGNVLEDWKFSELGTGQAILCFPHAEPFTYTFEPFRAQAPQPAQPMPPQYPPQYPQQPIPPQYPQPQPPAGYYPPANVPQQPWQPQPPEPYGYR
ncbi:MAG: type IV secretion system DNA-binding domain-containing protein [Clostridia bacterium]|nr:type IV secretion system DNA-binding domain-containing protein [Clostridia bacterium]